MSERGLHQRSVDLPQDDQDSTEKPIARLNLSLDPTESTDEEFADPVIGNPVNSRLIDAQVPVTLSTTSDVPTLQPTVHHTNGDYLNPEEASAWNLYPHPRPTSPTFDETYQDDNRNSFGRVSSTPDRWHQQVGQDDSSDTYSHIPSQPAHLTRTDTESFDPWLQSAPVNGIFDHELTGSVNPTIINFPRNQGIRTEPRINGHLSNHFNNRNRPHRNSPPPPRYVPRPQPFLSPTYLTNWTPPPAYVPRPQPAYPTIAPPYNRTPPPRTIVAQVPSAYGGQPAHHAWTDSHQGEGYIMDVQTGQAREQPMRNGLRVPARIRVQQNGQRQRSRRRGAQESSPPAEEAGVRELRNMLARHPQAPQMNGPAQPNNTPRLSNGHPGAPHRLNPMAEEFTVSEPAITRFSAPLFPPTWDNREAGPDAAKW